MEVLVAAQQSPVQAMSGRAVAGRFAEDTDALTGRDGFSSAYRRDHRLVCRAHRAVHDGDDATTAQHARIEDAARAGRQDGLARRRLQIDASMALLPWDRWRIEWVQHGRWGRSGQGPPPWRGAGADEATAGEGQHANDQDPEGHR